MMVVVERPCVKNDVSRKDTPDMAEDLAKLNRLRVNAGKSELKSWKAPQHKLEAAILKFVEEGYTDVLPGANTEAQPQTDDPEVAAALPPVTEEEPKPLSESALAKNVGKTEAKEEKPTTKGKASLARGLDTDTMAVQSRARVRDHREAEKKTKGKKVKLSADDRKQIKDEAALRRGEVDPKKDPEKAARQKKHIEEKQAKRAASGKSAPKAKGADEITVADIARELDIDPKVARAKLRRHEEKLTKLHTKGQDRWTFPKSAATEIKNILQGKK